MNLLNKVENFSKKISSKIFFNHSLKRLNWFGLGGCADIFFKPENLPDLVFFIKTFKDMTPIKVIGAGSNILIKDTGFKGAIIKLNKNFSHISKLDDRKIICGSASLDKKLSEFAMYNKISGLEFLSCIPGSIGGAIRMNSGCYDNDISKCLVSIQVIDSNGIIRLIKKKDIKFHYRGSNLPRDLVFLSGTFEGNIQDENKIKKKINEFVERKKISQPSKIKTGGSTFKNPVDQTIKKTWELIKEAKCDKLIIGDATVSSKHPNFFVNNGNATSKDMENLILTVKEKVLKNLGIKLELEIEIIG